MVYDGRKLCVVCAWRGTCQLKYSMPGGIALHCAEYTRDVTLREPEEERCKRNVLLEGPEGIGKTTLVKQVLGQAGLNAAGYYTREAKEGPFRSSLELVLLANGTERLVPLADTKPRPGWTKAGKRYVNLEGLEQVVVPALRHALQSTRVGLLVLDEVGPAECLSEQFRRQVVDCLTSNKSVLATMSLGGRDDEFLLSLESRSDVTVLPISYDNRHAFVELVIFMLTGKPTLNVEPV